MTILRNKQRRNEVRKQFDEKLLNKGATVQETVKMLRKILAQDQQQFCDYVGLSLATLRKIEQNRGNVTLATIDKILSKFGLELIVRKASH